MRDGQMKCVNYHPQETAKLYQRPINEKPKPLPVIDPSTWLTVWSHLEATKLVWEELDSSTSEYWRRSLDGYSEEDLMRGCDAADNWTKSKADFHVGAFKKLCAKPVNHPSHNEFEALPPSTMKPEARKEEMRKLRARVGI